MKLNAATINCNEKGAFAHWSFYFGTFGRIDQQQTGGRERLRLIIKLFGWAHFVAPYKFSPLFQPFPLPPPLNFAPKCSKFGPLSPSFSSAFSSDLEQFRARLTYNTTTSTVFMWTKLTTIGRWFWTGKTLLSHRLANCHSRECFGLVHRRHRRPLGRTFLF